MKKTLVALIICLFCIGTTMQSQSYTLSGYINDGANGEALVGATVYVEEIQGGTVSNSYGFYSLTLKKGKYNVRIAYLGYKGTKFQVDLNSNQTKDLQILSEENELNEVVVNAEKKDQNVKSIEMSVNKLQMKTIMKIPALMGEVDVLRTVQMLPGVQTVGEGSVGFYVRGGGHDQNLVLLDEATVYNASHLGGLFSVFNQDVVKDVTLYKGGIPSPFGGRLSSVLDVRMKEGNKKKFNVTGGIGLISSRLTVEGPIIKDKASFSVSGRRTYVDLFFPLLNDSNVKKSKAYFYDLNAKLNYQINEKNRLFVSGYFGRDVVKFGKNFNIDYGNRTLTTRFNHLFSPKLFSNLTFIYSEFDYGMGMPNGKDGFNWTSGIDDISLKNDYTWYLNTNNTLKFGGQISKHTFKPGTIKPSNSESNFANYSLPSNQALEYGAFIENDHKLTNKLSVRYGVRYSAFQNMGAYTSYVFDKSNPDEYVLKDSVKYGEGELFSFYHGFEPRLGIKYQLDYQSSLKLSYNRMNQYVHLTTNTLSITPFDVWFPSSPNIKPKIADQFAVGYFRNINDNMFEASVEVYYKKEQNAVDYKDHAEMLINKHYEGEIRVGEAYSYGVEFLLKKQSGRFTGWLGYTFSRAYREIKEVNDGKKYPAHYDKPHDLSLVLTYDITKRLNVSLSWFYSTGAARTLPIKRMEFGNAVIPIYSERNSARYPDYHRMDIGATYNFKKKPRKGVFKNCHSSLNVSVYNVYNRHNVNSITFQSDETTWYKVDGENNFLFKVLPSITYNFHF